MQIPLRRLSKTFALRMSLGMREIASAHTLAIANMAG
jgi:hypothetical protein